MQESNKLLTCVSKHSHRTTQNFHLSYRTSTKIPRSTNERLSSSSLIARAPHVGSELAHIRYGCSGERRSLAQSRAQAQVFTMPPTLPTDICKVYFALYGCLLQGRAWSNYRCKLVCRANAAYYILGLHQANKLSSGYTLTSRQLVSCSVTFNGST